MHMQPRVTAILVARNGAQYLERTLDALAAQTRRPDSVIFVDAGSTDASADLLIAAGPTQLVTTPGARSFGGAVAHAVQVAAAAPTDKDWLWLLAHDNAPEPGALAALLGALEIAPSVVAAGPKLMRWDQPDVISSYGETMTRFGASVTLVANELDQAQHDLQSDLLGIAAGGMLVRREVWSALGGFDPSLPSVDASLDFSVRVRLAGHRVIGVPAARVASAGGPELFGRKSVSVGTQNRLRRAAQLHRRLVYSPALAIPLHWLLLFPLAVIRSIGQLIGKNPGAIVGELSSGIAGAFDGRVGPARRNLRRSRRLGWAAVAPLRMSWAEVWEHRADARSLALPASEETATSRPGFFTGGGAWMVLLSGLIGALAFGPLIGAAAVSGGGILPLSSQFAELWSHVGYGWHDIGAGFVGAADPFSYLVALLGSLTFWAPSLSIVILYLVALPLAALAAWNCAARFAERGWAPAVAALLWAVAPPFLASLNSGHLGATIAHILLPWLVLATVNAARSWSLAAVAAVLFAIVAASAPIVVPALLVAWLAWMIARPARVHRLIGIPIPAVALFAPLVLEQLARGNWLGLLADPGVPVAGGTASGWQLVLGSTDATVNGWSNFLAALGLSPASAPIIVAALLAPLAAVSLLALFLPGSRRAIPSMVLAFFGLATAVLGVQIEVTIIGATTVPIWPGSGLSLFWLGLLGAAVAALEAIGRGVVVPAFVIGLAAVAVAVPLLAAPTAGTAAVTASTGRLLPAFVSAEAAPQPSLGTLELIAQADGGVSAILHRGQGTTLDEQSTFDATATSLSEADRKIATLAGNLASRSGFDTAAELDELQIGFVLVPDATSDTVLEARQRIAEALDGNRLLTPIGSTDNGFLWHYADLKSGTFQSGPGPTETSIGSAILAVQALVFALAFLLAIPTSRRRRVRAAAVGREEPAATFDEDDNA